MIPSLEEHEKSKQTKNNYKITSLSEFSVFASSSHHLCNKALTRKPKLRQYFRPISNKQRILMAILVQVSYNSESRIIDQKVNRLTSCWEHFDFSGFPQEKANINNYEGYWRQKISYSHFHLSFILTYNICMFALGLCKFDVYLVFMKSRQVILQASV